MLTDKELEELISRQIETKPTYLNLGGLGLTSLPGWVGDCVQGVCFEKATSIRSLDLNKNHLSELPDWIWELTSLETLSVVNSRLSSLSEEIGNLRELRGLYVSDNNLKTVPCAIADLEHLKLCSFKGNPIVSLPGSVIKRFPGLLDTCFAYNPFP